ncbi:hypothetical protein [Yoonia sp.]|uniref:hypothetical protein n=1 Tax=Yoonia sp. TaxID=2212373 RepID=UPI0025E4720D|nr:hypothetical protein [Yoonia sp.]
MNDVYEFRRAPGRGIIWLSATMIVLLISLITWTGAEHLLRLVWALGAVLILWMLLPKPVAGIRVDDDHLTLSAWRRPRLIALDDIAYLRATDISADSDITIVYKDGREEGAFAGDMPDIPTLSYVMAARGVPVRDIF